MNNIYMILVINEATASWEEEIHLDETSETLVKCLASLSFWRIEKGGFILFNCWIQ